MQQSSAKNCQTIWLKIHCGANERVKASIYIGAGMNHLCIYTLASLHLASHISALTPSMCVCVHIVQTHSRLHLLFPSSREIIQKLSH